MHDLDQLIQEGIEEYQRSKLVTKVSDTIELLKAAVLAVWDNIKYVVQTVVNVYQQNWMDYSILLGMHPSLV